MIYFAFAMLFLVAIAIGFFVESIKIKMPLWKRFLSGAGALCFEIAAFALWIQLAFPWWKNQLLLFAKLKSPQFDMGLMIPVQIPDRLVWFLFIPVCLLLFQSFGVAFNIRHTLKNPWIALGGLGLFAGIYHVSFMWFFQGIGTFVVLLGGYDARFPTGTALLASLSFTGMLIGVWTFYSLFGKRSGIKVFLMQIAVYLGICFIVWGVALITALPYAGSQKAKAISRGIAPFRVENNLPREAGEIRGATDALRKNHPLFELPFESVYDWKSNVIKAHLIPADRRKYTLNFFDSPEMVDLIRKREKMLKIASDKTVLVFPFLQEVRSYARTRAGRAALFMETKQPDKILPELMSLIVIDRDILNDSPFLISELLRIACRSIWYTRMVQLGPDGKQYASVYRNALQFMKSRKIHLPDEAGYYLGLFSGVKCGAYREILTCPSVNAMLGKGLSRTLALAPELEKQSRREVFQNISEDYERQALKGRISIVLGTTALALKCYRVEHGAYPDKLEKLVPEYLNKNFVCPYTGKSLIYNSDGKAFSLSLANDTPMGKITSEACY